VYWTLILNLFLLLAAETKLRTNSRLRLFLKMAGEADTETGQVLTPFTSSKLIDFVDVINAVQKPCPDWTVIKEYVERPDFSPTICDGDGRTLLSWASQYCLEPPPGEWHKKKKRRKDIWSSLLNQAPEDLQNEIDRSGRSPLFYAAQAGNDFALKKLLRKGVKSDDKCDDRGRTALSWAAGNRCADAISRLLGYSSIDPAKGDKDGYLPLHWLLRGTPNDQEPSDAYRKMVESLIWEQLSLWDEDFQCEGESTRIPKLLFYIEKDPTLLHKLVFDAVEHGNEDFFNTLLKVPGISTDERNTNGRTPLWLALDKDRKNIARLLMSGDNITFELLVQEGEYKLLQKLVKFGYNVNGNDNRKEPTLHQLVLYCNNSTKASSLLREILNSPNCARESLLEAKDASGKTALELAFDRGKEGKELVKEFLNHKAKFDTFTERDMWFKMAPQASSFYLAQKDDGSHDFEFYTESNPKGKEACDVTNALKTCIRYASAHC
jgi:ankyrin repeat protein